MDLKPYFARIGYQGSITPSIETLQAIHHAHVMQIPFENLSIQLLPDGEGPCPISLKPEDLIFKMIDQRRGGYCFETNELLAMALETIGFQVERLFARVLGAGVPRPLSHKLLLVRLDSGPWLADVGFGGHGLRQAIPLQTGLIFSQADEHFTLRAEQGLYTLSVQIGAQWLDLFAFNTTPYLAVDYEPANYYTATMPDSKFVQNRICTCPTPEGRITLFNNRLKIHEQQKTVAHNVATSEIPSVLSRYFGIELPPGSHLKPNAHDKHQSVGPRD